MTDENTNTPVNSPEKSNPEKPKTANPTKPESVSDTPRITNSQKEKDPRKVAAGKKLGAISRIAKSQKKYKAEAYNSQQQAIAANEPEKTQNFTFNNAVCVIVAVSVAAVVGLAYFKTKSTTTENNEPPKAGSKTQNPNLISLE